MIILILYWVVTAIIAFSYVVNTTEAKKEEKPVKLIACLMFALVAFYYVPRLAGQALARLKNS